jgi:hypothetical protein
MKARLTGRFMLFSGASAEASQNARAVEATPARCAHATSARCQARDS